MKIEAIVFDLDDTLLKDLDAARFAIEQACEIAAAKYNVEAIELRKTVRATAREIWYNSALSDLFYKVGMGSWEGLWMEIRTERDDTRELTKWLPEYREQVWNQSLAKHDIVDKELARVMSEKFQEVKRTLPGLFDDSISTLDKLKPKYRLAMLTNGQVDLQNDKIDISGLRDYFETIVISGEIGIGKPDSGVFKLLHERLNLKTDQTVMVGNSQKSDIAGAMGVGMKSIWLNRTGEAPDMDIMPQLEISSLNELFTILSAPRRPW